MKAKTAQAFSVEDRRKYIGASEVAAILGYDRFKTPLSVFQEKTGLSEPFTGNAHTQRGNALEGHAAEFYTDKTGFQLRRRSEAFSHPDHPFIVGHVDRIVVGQKRLVEIKCPSIAAFRKFQREGLPHSFVIQAQIYMGLSGYPQLTFVIFCADAWDAAIFDFDFDDSLYQAAIAGAAKFWNENVLTGTAPDPSLEEKGEIKLRIEEINTNGAGLVTFRDDEPFVAKAAALREAIELKRDAEDLFDLARKDFIQMVEDTPGIYETAGLRVHYNLRSGRTSFDKKALAKAHPEINLSAFEKTGSSYKEFRPYLLNSGERQ